MLSGAYRKQEGPLREVLIELNLCSSQDLKDQREKQGEVSAGVRFQGLGKVSWESSWKSR